ALQLCLPTDSAATLKLRTGLPFTFAVSAQPSFESASAGVTSSAPRATEVVTTMAKKQSPRCAGMNITIPLDSYIVHPVTRLHKGSRPGRPEPAGLPGGDARRDGASAPRDDEGARVHGSLHPGAGGLLAHAEDDLPGSRGAAPGNHVPRALAPD